MQLPALVLATVVAATLPPPTPGGDACRDGGGPEEACATVDVVANGVTALCRSFTDLPEEDCAAPSGRVVEEARVAAYETTWVARVHDLQRELGDVVPLADTAFLGTHNSYNAAAYRPTLSGMDPNQQYTIAHQLRLGVRSLELDVHSFPDPERGGIEPILCHATGPHVPCTTERHLSEGLAEIAAWLDRPDTDDEVLLVRIEDHLDGPDQHARAVAVVEEALGDDLHRTGGTCEPFPNDLTRAEVLAAGTRVLLLTDDCAGGAWGSTAWDYLREERKNDGFDGCFDDVTPEEYRDRFVRYFEDSTWVAVVTGTQGARTDAGDVAAMLRCGVNEVALDQLTPEDERLPAFLWTFTEGESDETGCAASGGDGRFASEGCGEVRPFACRAADGTWSVTAGRAPWRVGDRLCGGAFDVPRTAAERAALDAAKAAAGVTSVWLDYEDRDGDGDWTPGPR